ncbi:glycosyltransferase family 2 protein [Winogradskyella ouciana]|uniref:glycosyltransferase family 2 protein n=1 Tax=Winogradskyella ouciana TaxID=2608631 RepID=UPI003D28DF22
MSYTPLVSIIIPTFNRCQYIGEALDSIIAQTYTNWECIVVDDGSTDNTAAILKEYCNRDSRIQYLVRPDNFPKGSNGSRNYGVTISKGELIAFNDDDDFWLPNKLELQVPIFKQHPEAGLVTGHIEYVNEKGERSGRVIKQKGNHGKVFKDILLKNRMSMITPVLRRKVFDKVGFFNTDFKIFEDWEFWRRVAYYYPFYSIDKVLACVRKHDTNTSLIVTNDPFEQYMRYKILNKALLEWGKGRFTKADLKLIEKVSWKRYRKLLKNHCKGMGQKLLFFKQVFAHSFKDGLQLLILFVKYNIFNR